MYAISKAGYPFRVKNKNAMQDAMRDAWEMRPDPIIPISKNIRMRHAGVMVCGNELWIFYSRTGDKPEKIMLSRINIDTDWLDWKASLSPQEILRPEIPWEGANYKIANYKIRSSNPGLGIKQNALRDPYVYQEDENFYLLYSGSGEEAIGLAQIKIQNCN